MANTFKVSKITKVHVNSTNGTAGEIVTSDISSDDTNLDVNIADAETDPDDATYFTVSRLEGELGLEDFDALYVDTMNDGNTVEDTMTSRSKVYVQIELEGGTLQDGSGSTWFQVRPVVPPAMDVSTDDDLVTGMLNFTHSDHSGVQRPS